MGINLLGTMYFTTVTGKVMRMIV